MQTDQAFHSSADESSPSWLLNLLAAMGLVSPLALSIVLGRDAMRDSSNLRDETKAQHLLYEYRQAIYLVNANALRRRLEMTRV